ncbi:MAG: phosphotransferase family protein [Dehalococcoidia bacterium]|nr:phosphotransferase family protein [Dehalococcoidia bacterium]
MGESPPGLDLERLRPWFSEHVASVDDPSAALSARLRAQVIGHGRSNITYRVEDDAQQWVVRRPPLSHVQPTAHDMSREFRVISALRGTDVPVPKTYALCEDPGIIGAPFYVMAYVEGLVPVDPEEVTKRFDEEARRRLGEELIDTLAALHAVDPAEVGLADFGRPQGYIERQLRRFGEQLARVKTRELPELDELARRLAAALPAESDATIVHGDYRLDNAIVSDDARIAAVLDWEMSTLGDPLADLGILRMYWRDRDAEGIAAVGSTGVITLPGFPTWQEASARYEKRSGRGLGQLDFYIVLAHFKLAVILENMHARFQAGGTVGPGFETIGQQVLVLARSGLAVAEASEVGALRGA